MIGSISLADRIRIRRLERAEERQKKGGGADQISFIWTSGTGWKVRTQKRSKLKRGKPNEWKKINHRFVAEPTCTKRLSEGRGGKTKGSIWEIRVCTKNKTRVDASSQGRMVSSCTAKLRWVQGDKGIKRIPRRSLRLQKTKKKYSSVGEKR